MRVAIFAESYLPYVSGVTVSTEALARGLASRGHDVLVIAPRPRRGAEPGGAGALGPTPRYAWLGSYQLPWVVPSGYRMPWPAPWAPALREAAAFRPDVVHAQSPFVAGQLAHRLARRAAAPLVFTHHTRFADYGHYLGLLAVPGAAATGRYLLGFWRSCSAVVAPSSDLAAEIRDRLGNGSHPVVRVIPTGIETAGIRALEPVDSRPDAGWEAGTVVAATLGRLAPEKRVSIIFEALSQATVREPRLRLLVMGGGPLEASLRRRASAKDLADRIWFTGAIPRPEALARLRGADLFAFASDTETQGLVLAEALAAGLPAVALDGPGVGDSVHDGVDGLVLQRRGAPHDTVLLAEALTRLAGDRAMRSTMAARALADAGRFDIGVRLDEIEGLYAELLDGGARTSRA